MKTAILTLFFCFTTVFAFSQTVRNETELRLGTGLGGTWLTFEAMNGFKFGLFSVSAGVGLHAFGYPSFDEYDFKNTTTRTLIPVFINLKSDLMRGEIVPFLSCAIGYSFNAGNGFSGYGAYINPEVGLSFEVIDNFSLNFSLGYGLQSTQEMNNYVSKERHYAGGITFRTGFSF